MAHSLREPDAKVRPCGGRVVARFGSVVIAASGEAKTITGRSGREVIALPLKDVFLSYFTVVERLEREPGVGTWRACDLNAAGRSLHAAMWTLVDTEAGAEAAFFHARFDPRHVTVARQD